jgi:formylglycine-generating enzyme required for sulfatase activity
MGRFEVTAGEYTQFLNAVASTDTYGLYNWNMGDISPTHLGANIRRAGTAGNYSYTVAPDWANRPVNYVSWGDAARYCNWLTNGQPVGDQSLSTTEDGSYFLNGAITSLISVTRKANARFVLPTEDEWYKAAYFDPRTTGYFDFATGSNEPPSNILSSPDPGNSANFYSGNFTIGSGYYRTEVGAFANSASPFGTFDQGGNVWEWNEAVINGWYRGVRGGSFDYSIDSLSAESRSYQDPGDGGFNIGFRVVQLPEPCSLFMFSLLGAYLLRRRRNR